jgi:vitamin B12 transporter
MKRTYFILAGCSALLASWSWADNAPPAVSSATVVSTAPISIAPVAIVPPALPVSTPTIADEGETISTPTPHAITEPLGASFITLSRTRVPVDQLPANADIVFPEDARGYDALNAGELLSHEASIQLLTQGSPHYPLNARIRGADPKETLVLLDGRPMEGATLGAADLSEIPIEQIDHIEIVRGSQSSVYGPNAMGGVINVITKRAVYRGYPISHVNYEGASFSKQTYKLDYGSRQGPVDYFFYGDQQWQSGFRSNSDNSQYNLGGNAGLPLGRAGKILFDAGSYHNNSGVPGFRCDNISDPTCLNSTTPLAPNQFNNKDEKPANTPFARQVNDSNYLRASYLVSLSTDIFLAARFYGQEREVDLNDSGDPNPVNAISTDRREHSKGGDLQVNLPLGFLVGGSFIHDQEDLLDRLNGSNSFSGRTDSSGIFAQETLHWKALTLIPGGRYDENSQFGNTMNPRVQAIIDANDWLRFSASDSRSFRAPTMDESQLNPALLPEKAWSYEAGFEMHESSLSFRANVYRSIVGNEIESSTFSAANIGSATRQGVELAIHHVVSERYSETWNYAYLENTGVPAGFDHPVLLAYSPRHTANYTAIFRPSKKWEWDPTIRYEDSRYSGDDHTGTKMGSQVVMDLRLAYEWRQMELYFGIKDLMDKRYVDVPGYPLAGRTAYAGVRIRLWG